MVTFLDEDALHCHGGFYIELFSSIVHRSRWGVVRRCGDGQHYSDSPVALSGQMYLRISQKVESPVTATALAIETRRGNESLEQAIMVACDLVAIREGVLEKVRDRLKLKLPGFDVSKLFFKCHAHAHCSRNDRGAI